MTTLKSSIWTIIFFALISCGSKTENNITKNNLIAYKLKKREIGQIFPENRIRVAYLDTIIGDRYSLTIRFPNSIIPDTILHPDENNNYKDAVIYLPPQTIVLFDESGEMVTLTNVTNCISKFWCENDGGTKYEPNYVLTIDKKQFKRIPKLKDTARLGNISCFSIANYNPNHFKSFYTTKENDNVVMRGRLLNDYSG